MSHRDYKKRLHLVVDPVVVATAGFGATALNPTAAYTDPTGSDTTGAASIETDPAANDGGGTDSASAHHSAASSVVLTQTVGGAAFRTRGSD